MSGGLDFAQLRHYVVQPTLRELDLWSPAAEALLLGTAAQESRGRWLVQLGGGPARGIFQMEPATHSDIYENFLRYRPALAGAVRRLLAPSPADERQLVTNLAYAAAMCRIHYLRQRPALPEAGDIAGLARYWKRHYNTVEGAGTEAEFLENWRQLVAPVYAAAGGLAG